MERGASHGEASARRRRRALECAAWFVAFPVALAFARARGPGTALEHLALPALASLATGAALVAARDPEFLAGRELALAWTRRALMRVVLRFVVLGCALVAATAALSPEALFALPREQPGLFAVLVVVYPLASVLPQEFVFRAWFRRRYAALFGTERGFVAASALAFGLAHAVFLDPLACGLTAVGGALFADTYRRSGSFGLAVLEHASYGTLAFAAGLGARFQGGTLHALGG